MRAVFPAELAEGYPVVASVGGGRDGEGANVWGARGRTPDRRNKQRVTTGGASRLGDPSGLHRIIGARRRSRPLFDLAPRNKTSFRPWHPPTQFRCRAPALGAQPPGDDQDPQHALAAPWTRASSSIAKLNSFPGPMADSDSRFGVGTFAETWNGRLAMLGCVVGLATELLTGQGILFPMGLG